MVIYYVALLLMILQQSLMIGVAVSMSGERDGNHFLIFNNGKRFSYEADIWKKLHSISFCMAYMLYFIIHSTISFTAYLLPDLLLH
jgi:hypothetical protein